MPWATREAWLFRGGDYPDKGVNADGAMLARVVANTNLLTTPPPFDLEHGPTEGVLDFGRLKPGTLRVVNGRPPGSSADAEGAWIVGQTEVDPEVESRLKTRSLSVFLDTAKGLISKIAVTRTPRVSAAAFDTATVIFTGGSIMPDTTAGPTLSDVQLGALADLVAAKLKPADAAVTAEPAAAAPAPEPAPMSTSAEADPMDHPAVKAAFAALEQRLKVAESTTVEMAVKAQTAQIEKRKAELKQAGVPFWAVDALAPFEAGAEKAIVAFSEGDKTVAKELDAPAAIKLVLDGLADSGQFRRLVDVDTDREEPVNFSDAVLARANALQQTDAKLTRLEAIERATQQVRAAGVKEA